MFFCIARLKSAPFLLSWGLLAPNPLGVFQVLVLASPLPENCTSILNLGIRTIRIRTDGVIFLTQRVYPVPPTDKGIILPCAVIVCIQSMRGVKILAVVFVVLLVWVMSGTVLCTVRSANYIINAITKEIVFTQKKKPSTPIDGVAGFYTFIMLHWSRNHGKSLGQSLEPVGSEIFLARRA